MTKCRITRLAIAALCMILICSVILCGCSRSGKKQDGKEVGKWHADVKLSDIDMSALSDEDQAILAMIAGNDIMEIDVEFSNDGTFTYEVNTDALEDAVSGSVNNILGLFIDLDLSAIVDNLVGVLLPGSISASSDVYGKYSVDDNGLITADSSTGSKLYFSVYGSNVLIQVDENGNEVQKFNKQ